MNKGGTEMSERNRRNSKIRGSVPPMDNSNLAYKYDFSHFDESLRVDRKKQSEEREQKAQIRMAERESAAKAGSAMAVVIFAVVFFAAGTCLNYCRTESYDMASKIVAQRQALELAEEENALLQSKLDTKVNIGYIEEYASGTLGMTKVTAAQKSYVSVNTESLVEASDDKSGGLFGSISRWFSDLMEYIGF